jgi:hypothetical protein
MHGLSSYEIVADNQFSNKVPSQQNIYNARIIRQLIKGHILMTLMSEVFKAYLQPCISVQDISQWCLH